MAHQHSPGFLKIVEDAKKRIRETTIDDVKAKLDRGEKFLLIDVREESEYAADHLPGAMHLGQRRHRTRCRGSRSRPQYPHGALLWRRISLRSRRRQLAKDGLHERAFHGWRSSRLARKGFRPHERSKLVGTEMLKYFGNLMRPSP